MSFFFFFACFVCSSHSGAILQTSSGRLHARSALLVTCKQSSTISCQRTDRIPIYHSGHRIEALCVCSPGRIRQARR